MQEVGALGISPREFFFPVNDEPEPFREHPPEPLSWQPRHSRELKPLPTSPAPNQGSMGSRKGRGPRPPRASTDHAARELAWVNFVAPFFAATLALTSLLPFFSPPTSS